MRANKLTLHYMDMGVPIKGASILVVVGDNKTAVDVDADAATLPYLTRNFTNHNHKHHLILMLSFHFLKSATPEYNTYIMKIISWFSNTVNFFTRKGAFHNG